MFKTQCKVVTDSKYYMPPTLSTEGVDILTVLHYPLEAERQHWSFFTQGWLFNRVPKQHGGPGCRSVRRKWCSIQGMYWLKYTIFTQTSGGRWRVRRSSTCGTRNGPVVCHGSRRNPDLAIGERGLSWRHDRLTGREFHQRACSSRTFFQVFACTCFTPFRPKLFMAMRAAGFGNPLKIARC